MKPVGRTIQIFLPFGSPRGVKIAEITNRTVQAIYIPRHELHKAAERPEVQNVGLYFLFGQNAEDSKPQVYVGEAENCMKRLEQHHKQKEFWDAAVVFVTNNHQNQFTKTDVKFLEHLAYQEVGRIGRYKIDQTIPTLSFVPEWRQVDLADIFDTLKILLSTLGYPLFEEMRKTTAEDEQDVFYCRAKGMEARGEYNDEGFVVFKGSRMSAETTNSTHQHFKVIRETLIKDGIVTQNVDGGYVFAEDYSFPSPSQAAAIVLGRNSNGWKEWKSKEGKTLDELRR
ncbi:protein of unknown function [Salimicrobium salexigens]|uniref:DUF4357 domain-containing protein n=2 Tax=Salimicrobium salexigens TaxID=908941 RepID=A0ABY1KQY6_9BACI|nr:protein of unknown function [Salimicrobium salexigens]